MTAESPLRLGATGSAKDSRRLWVVRVAILALYAVLAVVATWPLVQHLSTHVPGSYTWAFDEYTFLYNMWWLRYSLFELGQNPLFGTHIFYPLGISFVLYTYNLFNALVSLPFQSFLTLPAISNLIFLFATAFSAYGTFLLVEYLLCTPSLPAVKSEDGPPTRGETRVALAAAFLAGLIYGFGSYRLVYAAIGHYNMWSTAWIPLYTLALLKTIREPQLRHAVLAGVFLVLAMLSDMIFGVFLGMLTVILLIFVLGPRGRQEVAGGLTPLLKRLVVLALVALILYAVVLIPILSKMFGDYELAGWGDAEKLSVDLMGLVTPTALHPLGGDWVDTLRQTREGTSRFRDVNTVFLGWAGLLLAIVGAVRYRRRLAAWITSFVVFVIFSLGPLLQINGRSIFDFDGLLVNVPLPFIVLHYIPLVKVNRVPNRFSLVLMLALAVLAGFGSYWLLGRLRRAPLLATLVGIILAGLVLFEHWSVPLPLTDASIPQVYEIVAAEPGDFAILQLPVGWRNSFGVQGAESTQTQYYQTYHHKRLLSGNISRNPPIKFDYFRRVPILDSLITIETYGTVDEARREADRITAAEFVAFYDLRYVVVAPGVPGRPPYVDTREDAVAYVEEVLPVEEIPVEGDWLLYRVEQPPLPAVTTVDFGAAEPLTAMALGEGWDQAEEIQGRSATWAVSQGAQLFLPADGGTDYRLTVTALPFNYPEAKAQRLAVRVNGQRLESLDMSPAWDQYTWEVPESTVRQGLNEVRFEFERLDAPADVLPVSGAIGATGVVAPVAIEVNSGGPESFAYITIGDEPEAQDASVHRPGYNVAVIDPESGELLQHRGFDTTPSGNQAEATAMADFIAGVPQGQIVVVALQDDGAVHLTTEAVAALRAIGGEADLRATNGWSQAIIGAKGAEPGAAMESVGPGNAWLRVAPDRRTLAIAVDAVVWEGTGSGE